MLVSVVVSTHEQPAWLAKVLWGLAAQADRGFEVVVADDGSGPETAAVIGALAGPVGRPLTHVRQEHRGFGKCSIVNQAILAARGEYLVFLDGDCVPRGDFLAIHRALAAPGRFLSGGALRLPAGTSAQVTAEDITSGRVFEPAWLRARGVPRSRQLVRLGVTPGWARLLDAITPTRPTFNGGNASAWRRDVVAVNGFDERMVYGGEDREFGLRLELAGVRGRQVRHRAVVLHLDHPRTYRSAEGEQDNLAIRRETSRLRRIRAVTGLDRYSAAG